RRPRLRHRGAHGGSGRRPPAGAVGRADPARLGAGAHGDGAVGPGRTASICPARPRRRQRRPGRDDGDYGRFLGLTLINPLPVIYFTSMVLGNVVGRPVGAAGAIVFAVGAFAASPSWQLLLAGVGAFGRRGLPPTARVVALVVGNLIILGLAVRMLVH